MRILLDQSFPEPVQGEIRGDRVVHVNESQRHLKVNLIGKDDWLVYEQAVKKGFDCVLTPDINTF